MTSVAAFSSPIIKKKINCKKLLIYFSTSSIIWIVPNLFYDINLTPNTQSEQFSVTHTHTYIQKQILQQMVRPHRASISAWLSHWGILWREKQMSPNKSIEKWKVLSATWNPRTFKLRCTRIQEGSNVDWTTVVLYTKY